MRVRVNHRPHFTRMWNGFVQFLKLVTESNLVFCLGACAETMLNKPICPIVRMEFNEPQLLILINYRFCHSYFYTVLAYTNGVASMKFSNHPKETSYRDKIYEVLLSLAKL